MNEKQLQKLVKKLSGQAEKPKRPPKTYDKTLDVTKPPESTATEETRDFFDEMKRREF
jgi:hypothetical protein